MADQAKPKPQAYRAIDMRTNDGQWVAEEVVAQVREQHARLDGAVIVPLFKDNWSEDKDGNVPLGQLVKVNEMWWRLLADIAPGTDTPDYLLVLNGQLWPIINEAARKYVVDELLSYGVPVKDKSGDQAEDVTGRTLWKTRKAGFVGFPGPIARHGLQLDKIKAFLQEATGGGQLKLDAPPTRARKPAAEKRDRSPKLAREPEPEPVYYYVRKTIDGYGPVALRFSEADRRVESLTGVRYLEDGDSSVPEELPYLTGKGEIREMRKALERERDAWQPTHAVDLEGAPAH